MNLTPSNVSPSNGDPLLPSMQTNFQDESANKAELADLIQKLMSQKAALLEECFSMKFDESGNLVSIPKLIEGYIPNTDYLPSLILSLAREVDWTDEKQCFRDVALVSNLDRLNSSHPILWPTFTQSS